VLSGKFLEDEAVGENGASSLSWLVVDRQSQSADDGGDALRASGCYCALKRGRAWLALCFRATRGKVWYSTAPNL
jgi:hypothetical protein